MSKVHLLGSLVVALLSFSGVATAQGTISVPATAHAGDSVTVSYTNPNLAGQTVTIDIDNGGYPNPVTTSRQITLDAEGKGSFTWTVPDWIVANFNAPGASEAVLVVDP